MLPPSSMQARSVAAPASMTRSSSPGCAHVEKNVRMQIAIAGMKDIGDAKIKFFADRGDAPHHLRQLAARHDAVLDVIIRRQSAHGAESAFAAFP